jgi:spore germination protein
MREIFEALGAKVSYNTKRQIVTAVRGGTDVQVKLKGLPRMDIQGTPARLSDAESPFVYNGTTMIPLRVVSQALGAKVVYTPHKTKPVISIDS